MKKIILLWVCVLLTQLSFSQCSSFQIVADKSSACAPDIIRYQLLNPVAGSTYEWNVGGGSVFGADTFYGFHTSAMVINATCTVTLPNGTTCVVTENAIATVHPVPVPQFQASKIVFCEGPDSLILHDITTNSASRNWIVDGTNYNNAADSIIHTFVTNGFKKVSLIVIDSFGCKGVGEWQDTIKIYPDMVFDFAPNNPGGCVPMDVDYSLTQDPNTPFTKTYSWTFPGASSTTGSGPNPATRTYSDTGFYDAQLQVDVSNGCTYFTDKSNILTVGDTVSMNLSVASGPFCTSDTIGLVQTVNPLPGSSTTWTYNGLAVTENYGDDYSKNISAADTGWLSVTLAHNYNGCITTKTFNQYIEVRGVRADFTSTDHFHCDVPHTVHLTNTSDPMDASSLTYKWRILNGSTPVDSSFNENDSFTFYNLPAFHTVQLIAIGDNGCRDTITRQDYIYQDSLRVAFTANPLVGCVGQEITFQNGTIPSTYTGPDMFKWFYFDKDDTTILDSATTSNGSYTYSDTGFYDVKLIGYNAAGCTDTITIEEAVEIINPIPSYIIYDTIVCSGDFMDLEGTTQHSSIAFTHDWKLAHQGSATTYSYSGTNVQARPLKAGTYDLIYTSSINGGCYNSDTSEVYVNEIVAEVINDTLGGCAPLVVHPTINVLSNYHFGNPSDSITYLWSVSPFNAFTTIDSNTSSNPAITLNADNTYLFQANITNSVGCVDFTYSQQVFVGVRSGFTIDDDIICLGDQLRVTDESFNGVSNTEWIFNPSIPVVSTQDTGRDVLFEIPTPGSYTLTQVVTNDSNCYDTTVIPFEVQEVIASFEAVDSFLQCAPVYAEFISTSINADTLCWDFGDGNSNITTSTSAGNIYTKNSGLFGGYDIQLIAKNIEGCTDTAVREDYLVVQGPVANFTMENFIGCEPLSVTFTDHSIDVDRFYLNYNDGTILDSTYTIVGGDTILGVHPYMNVTASNLRQAILPSMIVYDSLGCAEVFVPDDSIIVYKKPIIEPVLDPSGTEFCIPFNYEFQDTGSWSSIWNWSLDQTVISTESHDSLTQSTAGTFDFELISSNIYGCLDTFTTALTGYDLPVVNFTLDDTICLNNVVQFDGSIESSTDVAFEWNFGDPGMPGNIDSTDLNTSYTYTTTGVKNISLKTQTPIGCSDSANVSVVITGPMDIDNPQINYVSFNGNYELEINYNQSAFNKFLRYQIERTDGNIINVDDLSITTVNDIFAIEPIDSQCYDLTVVDYCDIFGQRSEKHCFIHLSATSINTYENLLTWTPYTGWTSVNSYEIYRKDLNGVFVQIGSVNGATTEFTDENLCDRDYEYYVQATHPTTSDVSQSFRVIQRPLYDQNLEVIDMKYVTVNGSNEIEVVWEESNFSQFSQYRINKYETNEGRFVESFTQTETTLTDYNVLTDQKSYVYYVFTEDQCGDLSDTGREGKSILLNALFRPTGTLLEWTAYRNWENDVVHYNVELMKATGFEFIHRNDGTDRDYTDQDVHLDVPGEYCYRVHGVSDDGDTSYSNATCVYGEPDVLLPTAFTPNNDNLNETFRPITKFVSTEEIEGVQNFKFCIYSRWGEKIFETTDALTGWDGSYKDREAQQGVYIFTLQARGIDKQMIYQEGNVTLLR